MGHNRFAMTGDELGPVGAQEGSSLRGPQESVIEMLLVLTLESRASVDQTNKT